MTQNPEVPPTLVNAFLFENNALADDWAMTEAIRLGHNPLGLCHYEKGKVDMETDIHKGKTTEGKHRSF